MAAVSGALKSTCYLVLRELKFELGGGEFDWLADKAIDVDAVS